MLGDYCTATDASDFPNGTSVATYRFVSSFGSRENRWENEMWRAKVKWKCSIVVENVVWNLYKFEWTLFKKLKRIVKKRFKVYFTVVYSWAHLIPSSNKIFIRKRRRMQLLSEMVDCRMYMTNAALTGYYVEQGLVETLRVTLFWGAYGQQQHCNKKRVYNSEISALVWDENWN